MTLPIKELRIVDGVLNWTPETLEWIQELCMHAVTNSLDHGFILPKQKGRDVEAHELQISARDQSDTLNLEIIDNGVGLDMQHIEQICLRKGFQPTGIETQADVFFLDGVSTAGEVTLRTGRGVGLSAIKARVGDRGGFVTIANRKDGHGTILSIRIPFKHPTSLADESSARLIKTAI